MPWRHRRATRTRPPRVQWHAGADAARPVPTRGPGVRLWYSLAMGTKRMSLRRDDQCSNRRANLPAGTRAQSIAGRLDRANRTNPLRQAALREDLSTAHRSFRATRAPARDRSRRAVCHRCRHGPASSDGPEILGPVRIATWNVERPKPKGWKVPPAQRRRMADVGRGHLGAHRDSPRPPARGGVHPLGLLSPSPGAATRA